MRPPLELRHLRYFIAVAEELHFARAAERLGIEQSPLSRAIRELETIIGARLLDRTTRGSRLTWAGEVFLAQAYRVLGAIEEAEARVRAAAAGITGRIRVGFSDGIAQPRLSALLAQCRAEEPEVEVSVFEMPFAQQVKGIQEGLLDVGLALAPSAVEGLRSDPLWKDPIAVVLPKTHPLADKHRVTLAEAMAEPLLVCHPDLGSGCHAQLDAIIRSVNSAPRIADYATTLDVLLTLVGAGYGVGFALATLTDSLNRPDIVIRPLAGRAPTLITYLLHQDGELSEPLVRFVERARALA